MFYAARHSIAKFIKFYLILSLFIFPRFGFSSEGPDFNELALPESTKNLLSSQWGENYETPWEKTWRFPIRLFSLPIKRLVSGKIGQSVGALLSLPYSSVHPHGNPLQVLYKSTLGYGVSPLMPVSSVVSDVFSAGKSIGYANFYNTSRIQVCTIKLPLAPFEHVFLKVDNTMGLDSDDGVFDLEREGLLFGVRVKGIFKDGSHCFNLPIRSQESPSMAIERLTCMMSERSFDRGTVFNSTERFYKGPHSRITSSDKKFFSYNCGGIAREMAHSAGLCYPDVSNLGIGSNFLKVPDVVIERIAKQQAICDGHINSLRKLIFDLEVGEESETNISHFLTRYIHSKDVALQLIISAQRGKRSTNIDSIKKWAQNFGEQELSKYMQTNGGVSAFFSAKETQRVFPQARATLKAMFASMSAEDLDAIQQLYPILREINNDLQKPYY